MFKKKPVTNLSHSQQLEAVQAFAAATGDVMAICSVSAKRKGEKLKKRFIVILKEKVARDGAQYDLNFINIKLSDAKPQLCKKRFRLCDISKLTANDDLSAEEFTIITSKPYVFLARSREERDDFVCNLLHLFKEHVGKALPVEGVNLTDLKLRSPFFFEILTSNPSHMFQHRRQCQRRRALSSSKHVHLHHEPNQPWLRFTSQGQFVAG
jgi:hypothetical protein